jgi:hypothetical protein
MKFNIEGITEQSGIYIGKEEYDTKSKPIPASKAPA